VKDDMDKNKEKLIRLIDKMTENEVIEVSNYIEFMRMRKVKKESRLEKNTIDIGEKDTYVDNKMLPNDKNSNEKDKKRNSYCHSGFIMGLLSIFLNDIGILPLATIVVSIIGLAKYDNNVNKDKWQGIVGLILGILFFLVHLNNYGHFGY